MSDELRNELDGDGEGRCRRCGAGLTPSGECSGRHPDRAEVPAWPGATANTGSVIWDPTTGKGRPAAPAVGAHEFEAWYEGPDHEPYGEMTGAGELRVRLQFVEHDLEHVAHERDQMAAEAARLRERLREVEAELRELASAALRSGKH